MSLRLWQAKQPKGVDLAACFEGLPAMRRRTVRKTVVCVTVESANTWTEAAEFPVRLICETIKPLEMAFLHELASSKPPRPGADDAYV